MQMSQVSLPLDEGSMKFTLSEDRRQELGGVVQFHDYYETGPEQLRDLKRGDSSKQKIYNILELEPAPGEIVFGNYINTVFPPSGKRRPTSAAYRPSSASAASSKPPRPWSGVSVQ